MVTKADPTKQIHTVLYGSPDGRAGGVLYTIPMPPFGSILTDAEITDIIDYERSSWGNHARLVIEAHVAAERGRSK